MKTAGAIRGSETTSAPGERRDEELLRLAACIADGMPLGAATLASAQPIGADERDAFAMLDRLTQGFRRALNTTDRAAPVPAFRFAGLDVFEKLAEGSYGEVHRAWDPMLGQPVALKLLKPDSGLLADAFLAEARSLARLRHPNILNVFGAAVENGRAGLWTELVTGDTLQDLVARGTRLSADDVRSIGCDLCSALAYIHRQQLTHGDVKPANIVRDDFGRVVLMDFGAARSFSDAQAGDILQGSRRYLAPEVLRGAPITPASDIYALGVTLFVLLTGSYPSDAAGATQALGANVPRAVRRAIDTALRDDPHQRHRSASAFAAALAGPQATSRGTRAALGIAALALLASAVAVHQATRVPAWNATSTFYRASADGGYRALADGAALRIGDTVALEFQTSQPAWLYVIDDDGSADPAALFPSDELVAHNPIAPGAPQRLPGMSRAGGIRDWQVNTDASAEHIVVVAAPAALPTLEAAMTQWLHATSAAAVPDARRMRRGAYGLAPASSGPTTDSAPLHAISAELDALRAEGKVRVWEFTFPRSDHTRE